MEPPHGTASVPMPRRLGPGSPGWVDGAPLPMAGYGDVCPPAPVHPLSSHFWWLPSSTGEPGFKP